MLRKAEVDVSIKFGLVSISENAYPIHTTKSKFIIWLRFYPTRIFIWWSDTRCVAEERLWERT